MTRRGKARNVLFWFGFEGGDDAGAFADGEDLIGFYLGEFFQLLGGGPFYFDEIDGWGFA